MINPAELVDTLVDALRHIPELIEEMDGDATRIRAYHDAYPTITSWELAVGKEPSPSILAIWMETVPSSVGEIQSWEHRVSLFLRARRVPMNGAAQVVGYYRIFQALIDGIPTNGNSLPMVNYQVHSECLPMELPSMSRKVDAEGVNFFEVMVAFKELHA